jgi:hypothetical protein
MLVVPYTPPGFAGRAGQGRKGRKGPETRESPVASLKPQAKRCSHIKTWEKDIEQQNIDLFNKSGLVGFNFF